MFKMGKLLSPLSISLTYFVVGALWITFSDNWVADLADDSNQLGLMQTYKGWFYIAITAIPLYFLIKKHRNYQIESRELLAVTERRYEYLFLNNPYPLMVCKIDSGEPVFFNKAMMVTFGYSMKEFENLTLFDLFSLAEQKRLKNKLSISPRVNHIHIFKGIKKNGDEILLDVSLYDVQMGSENKLMFIFDDVTSDMYNREQIRKLTENLERKVAERTLELQNVNDELEAFTYSVSHDLRAPLRAIDGFSLAILDEAGDSLSKQSLSHLQRVRNASQKMSDLIDDLLRLSRITKANLKPRIVNISGIAQTVCDEFCRRSPDKTYKITIQTDLEAYADEGHITILLENLLSNAFKYSSKKEFPEIEVGMVDKDGTKVFYVKDNGSGFDTTYTDKLFKPFQRLHDSSEFTGTGVGLATVMRIIKRHNGVIYCDSKIDEGATFYFEIPPSMLPS